MRSAINLVVLGALLLGSAASPSEAGAGQPAPLEAEWTSALDREIAELRRRFKGRIAVYVSDPTLGITYRHDAEAPIYIASGVKVPFMIEVFRQAELGLLSMDETIRVEAADLRDGAPQLGKAEGRTVTIRELLRIMVQYSDNAASDLLANRVGVHNVNTGLAALGVEGVGRLTTLLDVRIGVFRALDRRGDDLDNLEVRKVRWTWGWKRHLAELERALGKPPGSYTVEQLHAAYDRYYATGVNHAKVEALGHIIERMLAGTLVSPAASAEMLDIMRGAKTSTRRLLGKLPRGTRVAHKTGSQYERICDYGAIDLPDGKPLVVAACLAGGGDRNLAEATLASVARKAWDLGAAAHR